jgi:hypothetical protein
MRAPRCTLPFQSYPRGVEHILTGDAEIGRAVRDVRRHVGRANEHDRHVRTARRQDQFARTPRILGRRDPRRREQRQRFV